MLVPLPADTGGLLHRRRNGFARTTDARMRAECRQTQTSRHENRQSYTHRKAYGYAIKRIKTAALRREHSEVDRALLAIIDAALPLVKCSRGLQPAFGTTKQTWAEA